MLERPWTVCSYILLCGVLVSPSCSPSASSELEGDAGSSDAAVRPFVPVLKSDFEPGNAQGLPAGEHNRIVFLENLGDSSTGQLFFGDPPKLDLYYEDGTSADRYARLIDDPTDPGNTVLHYWLQNAVIPTGYQDHAKGRIQTTVRFGAEAQVTRLYMKQRIYLHPDIAKLGTYPNPQDWWLGLIIQTLWIGAQWEGDPNPSRISVLLAPNFSDGTLRLGASLNHEGGAFWTALDPSFVVPTGEWITVEVGYLMGDADSGRFVMRAQRQSDAEPITIADVTDYTYNPSADQPGGTGPVPLTHWNPHKIYGSDNVLHHIRDGGGAAQLFFDDFEVSDRWPENWP